MHNKHSLSEENKEMLRNQAIELIHHADELISVLEKSEYIEPWVLAKAERATTDLSDITHYLEGHSEEMHDMDKFEDGGYMKKGGVSDIIVIDILHYPSKKRALNTEISNEVLDKIDRYFTFVPNTNQEYVVKLKGASRGEYGINKEQGDKIIEIINNTEFKKMSDGGYMAKGGYISDRQMQSLNSGYELVIRTTLPDYHIIIKKEKGEIVYVIKKGRVYSAKKVKTFTSEKDAFTYLTNMAGEKVTKKKLED
jgi:hypothetical protein